jgi:IS5 family transposase
MEQQPFSEVTFELYRKPTRREWFLDEANRVVPWVSRPSYIGPNLNPEILP